MSNTHLFEEPGALEQVARLARDWFQRFLTPKTLGVTRAIGSKSQRSAR